ncbi:MAG TPA: hypothetical protein VH144_02680 [Candidatus Saccharimonadales bacterium]|jgi:hypothetical protein|nr:hypothetical protein [Candidatus Saccharimonadales bacterium]
MQPETTPPYQPQPGDTLTDPNIRVNPNIGTPIFHETTQNFGTQQPVEGSATTAPIRETPIYDQLKTDRDFERMTRQTVTEIFARALEIENVRLQTVGRNPNYFSKN